MSCSKYVVETIESLIYHKIYLENKDFYSEIAERFVDYVWSKYGYDDLQLSKRFYVGAEDINFFQFCLNDEQISKLDFDTGLMEYRENSVYIKYVIHNNIGLRFQEARKKGYQHPRDVTIRGACEINMTVADMVRYSNSVIRIVSIINLNERQSIKVALQNFCTAFRGHPIVLEAGYLFAGQYSEYYNSGVDDLLEKLETLYGQYGFINVNNYIGCYEEQIAMVNNNGSNFIKKYNAITNQNITLQQLNQF